MGGFPVPSRIVQSGHRLFPVFKSFSFENWLVTSEKSLISLFPAWCSRKSRWNLFPEKNGNRKKTNLRPGRDEPEYRIPV
jgi:hypothetical protein